MGLLDTITRTRIGECQHAAGFSPIFRPTAANLDRFLVAAGASPANRDLGAVQEILDRFTVAHELVSKNIEIAILEGGLGRVERQAPGGPYDALADLLAEFLVGWGELLPFGEDSLLAGLIFCEHILAMHGLTVDLAYGENELRGAVIRWCRAISGEIEVAAPDPRASLQKAILGRFRTKVD